MTRAYEWVDERYQISGLLSEIANKPVHSFARWWWYCLGGITALLFVIQATTGIMLALYYKPTAAEAYASIQLIENEVYFGAAIRAIHHWSANGMIVMCVAHMIRVFILGAYKRPRELNWISGVMLLILTLAFGFTGGIRSRHGRRRRRSSSQIARTHTRAADTTAAVETFMRTIDHPFKKEMAAIRLSILGVAGTIAEGIIKWNAPSFRTGEYFATINLREKKGIGVILHLGAKTRVPPTGGMAIDDPEKLLRWLAKDRATIVFESLGDFKARKAAFERIVEQWIAYV